LVLRIVGSDKSVVAKLVGRAERSPEVNEVRVALRRLPANSAGPRSIIDVTIGNRPVRWIGADTQIARLDKVVVTEVVLAGHGVEITTLPASRFHDHQPGERFAIHTGA
jgi:hypothetical protein